MCCFIAKDAKTTFPPKLKKFKRVPGIPHLVYFAVFTSAGKVSDGISEEHVIDLKPSLWTSSELPNTGPSCLPFFYSSIPLEFREKEKDYMKKSQELEVVKEEQANLKEEQANLKLEQANLEKEQANLKLEQANLKAEKLEAMLKEKNQKRVRENEQKVIMEQLQEKFAVKITELDKELALKITELEKIDKELALKITELEKIDKELALKITELEKIGEELAALKEQQQNDMDYYFSENDRTSSLYLHLSSSGELAEVHSCQLDGTYRKPVDEPICQINGGCDILFYSKKCVSIEITDAPDNHPNENCKLSSNEIKLQTGETS